MKKKYLIAVVLAALIASPELDPFGKKSMNPLSSSDPFICSPVSAQDQLNKSSLVKEMPESKYFYQVKSGECINAKGEKGYNTIELDILFDGVDESQLSSPKYQPKQAYKNKNAECVDFSNFDFNRIIKLSYVRLEKWNFRGAKLDGAAFAFAKMIDADLRGARLSGISIGYTYISGKIDQFTEYPKVCVLHRIGRADDSQKISCEL